MLLLAGRRKDEKAGQLRERTEDGEKRMKEKEVLQLEDL